MKLCLPKLLHLIVLQGLQAVAASVAAVRCGFPSLALFTAARMPEPASSDLLAATLTLPSCGVLGATRAGLSCEAAGFGRA
jgi:hypothetical protein